MYTPNKTSTFKSRLGACIQNKSFYMVLELNKYFVYFSDLILGRCVSDDSEIDAEEG